MALLLAWVSLGASALLAAAWLASFALLPQPTANSNAASATYRDCMGTSWG